MSRGKRIYALDTNVLLHDPTALFRFEEHDVFIPMKVLEELDEKKNGSSELARNARQASRFFNELIEGAGRGGINGGLPLRNPGGVSLGRSDARGKLWFQSKPGNGNGSPDNQILGAVLALREAQPDTPVVLVSKDINLRIKAGIQGLSAEDYENDRALDDFALLFAGHAELPDNFWPSHPELRSWAERGRTYYELTPRKHEQWYPQQCLYLPGENSVELRVLSM
ncbi:PhoH family protein, partial [mine drainage metagenome]